MPSEPHSSHEWLESFGVPVKCRKCHCWNTSGTVTGDAHLIPCPEADPEYPSSDATASQRAAERRRFELVGHALEGILANPTWNSENLLLRGMSEREAIKAAGILAVLYADSALEALKETK